MQNNTKQLATVSVDMLVPEKHPYRFFAAQFDYEKLFSVMEIPQNEVGADGFGADRLMKCTLLRAAEDLSGRQAQRFLAENVAAKWFCGFGLFEKTPEHSTLSKFFTRVGVERMGAFFDEARRQLKEKGYLQEFFTFVDSTALISKLQVWEERDKAIQAGYEDFNNEVLSKISKDPDVRIGAKSSKKFWTGFKKNVSRDMQDGLINKVTVTHANRTDADCVDDILPDTGAVSGDKGFVPAIPTIEARGLHSMVILRNNMKDKNPEKDSFITKLRSPFEGAFAHQNRRARYRGIDKNQMSEYLNAFAFNLKTLLAIEVKRKRIPA